QSEKELHVIKELTEFSQVDSSFSEHAAKSLELLNQLFPSNAKLSPADAELIQTLRQHLEEIQKIRNIWENIIPNEQSAFDLTKIFTEINQLLGDSEKNQEYKQRLNSCYWITQSYMKFISLFAVVKQRAGTGDLVSQLES